MTTLTKRSPSQAVALQFPEALNWSWYMVTDEGGERGPFIMTQAEVAADLARGQSVTPYHRHDRPTVCLSAQQVEQRFPRVCAALAGSGYFTWGEATYIVRDYMRGMDLVWFGRRCSQIIPDELSQRRVDYRKTGMQWLLQRYRERSNNA